MTLNFPGDFQICFGGHCHFFRIRIEIKKIFSKFSKNSIFKISCDNQHRSQTKNATGRSFEALTRPFKMTARSKLAFCRVKKRPSRKFRKKNLTLAPLSIWIQLLLHQVVFRRHNRMDISLKPFSQILSSCSERWRRFFFDSEIDDNLIQKRMIWIYAELGTLIDYHCLLLISTWIFTFAFWSMIYTLSIILFWHYSRFQSNHCRF